MNNFPLKFSITDGALDDAKRVNEFGGDDFGHLGKRLPRAGASSTRTRISRGLVVVAALIAGPSSMAQDSDEIEVENPLQMEIRRQVIVHDQIAKIPAALQRKNIERQVYNTTFGSAAYAQTKAEWKLRLQIENLDRVCSLTESQKKKLRLAGFGEMKQFAEEIEAKIRELQAVQITKANQVWVELRPLRVKVAKGFFETETFYGRTVKSVLDVDQMSAFETDSHGRRDYWFQAKLELALHVLDGRVGFRDDQGERLLKILQAEVPVPNVINRASSNRASIFYVVDCMARIPEAKLRPIFDEDQWRLLQSLFQAARKARPYMEESGFELPAVIGAP